MPGAVRGPGDIAGNRQVPSPLVANVLVKRYKQQITVVFWVLRSNKKKIKQEVGPRQGRAGVCEFKYGNQRQPL